MPVFHQIECIDKSCAACLRQQRREITRRSFFASFLGAGSALIAGVVGYPLLKFVMYPIRNLSNKAEWSQLGDATSFQGASAPVVRTISLIQRDGWRETVTEQDVYISRAVTGELHVLSPICPHLGCSVSWHESQNKFICPCHGGQFDALGQRISGPPPRGLDRLDARVTDGKLEVQFVYFRSNVAHQEVLS